MRGPLSSELANTQLKSKEKSLMGMFSDYEGGAAALTGLLPFSAGLLPHPEGTVDVDGPQGRTELPL